LGKNIGRLDYGKERRVLEDEQSTKLSLTESPMVLFLAFFMVFLEQL